MATPRSIQTRHRSARFGSSKVVFEYRDGVYYRRYDSAKHASHYNKDISLAVFYHILKGDAKQPRFREHADALKREFYYVNKSPYVIKKAQEDQQNDNIPESELNRQVAIFDRYGSNQFLGTYANVTQCAHALQRPVKTIYQWLTGARQTDLYARYKFLDQCTQSELDNKYIPNQNEISL